MGPSSARSPLLLSPVLEAKNRSRAPPPCAPPLLPCVPPATVPPATVPPATVPPATVRPRRQRMQARPPRPTAAAAARAR
eukprot:7344979-Prymnesium_polylepis.1